VAIPTSEMSVLTTVMRGNIPEDGILHSHRRGNLKSYTISTSTGNNKFNAKDKTNTLSLEALLTIHRNFVCGKTNLPAPTHLLTVKNTSVVVVTRTTEFRIPVKVEFPFHRQCVHTSSMAHHASHSRGIGAVSLRVSTRNITMLIHLSVTEV
jgi:hypothetical protein